MASKARTNKTVSASKVTKGTNIYAPYFAAIADKPWAVRYQHLTKVAPPEITAKLVARLLKEIRKDKAHSDAQWLDTRQGGLNGALEEFGYHPIVSVNVAVDAGKLQRQFKRRGVIVRPGAQQEYEVERKQATRQESPHKAAGVAYLSKLIKG